MGRQMIASEDNKTHCSASSHEDQIRSPRMRVKVDVYSREKEERGEKEKGRKETRETETKVVRK